MRSKQFAVCAIAALLLGAMAPQARAAFIINLFQNGSDLDAVGSGTFNLSALTPMGKNSFSQASIIANEGLAELGTDGFDEYAGFTGPSSLGPGSSLGLASVAAGGYAGVFAAATDLRVPAGYTSGTFFSDSATYSNQSFASLGLTPGIYTYTWGSGLTADSLVVNIGAAPASTVPLPPAMWSGLVMLTLLGGWMLLRNAAPRRA